MNLLALLRTSAVTLITSLLLGACGAGGGPSDQSSPRPLSLDEANQLAQVRYDNYLRGGAHFQATVPLADDAATLQGSVDWRRHRGSGLLTVSVGGKRQTSEIAWTGEQVWIVPLRDPASGSPPTRPHTRRVDPLQSPLDRALTLILNLAAKRPENPQLLMQNQAAWVRSDKLHGVPVQVLRGPAVRQGGRTVAPGQQRTYYWIDANGRLHRFEARTTESGPPLVVDIDSIQSQAPQNPATPGR